MSGSDQQEAAEKSHDPTPQKLRRARRKGEVARSADLSVAAAYAGLGLAFLVTGGDAVARLGAGLAMFLDRPDDLAAALVAGPSWSPAGRVLSGVAGAVAAWFLVPAVAVLASVGAQRALVFAPSKLRPRLSRISPVANARNKFGPSGLFEFLKSLAKLVIYSVSLALFLRSRLEQIVSSAATEPGPAAALMARLCLEFLVVIFVIAAAIGALDLAWQHRQHLRKNRMTRKEVMDETKESEGDPHIKSQRRQRGQEIARNRMMAEIPLSDVVIVNPTHYAVCLKWSRRPGSAPVCVAKGVDEMAAAIRRAAIEAGVPVHRDPPTARALHASTALGEEIAEEHYRAVAAAIRFAENMRRRAREQVT